MRKFSDLQGIHRGETCVVVGNGPSLRFVDDYSLVKYPTIGSNKIYLRFTPTYYVCVNPLVIEQNIDEILGLATTAFLPPITALPGDDMEIFTLHNMAMPMFSYDPTSFIHEGHTVTFVAMQLAFFLGFTKVLLVGVDHRYQYEGESNEEHLLVGDDNNHFDPRYFSGQRWNNPDLEASEFAYQLAYKAFLSDGRSIINLTDNSALEVFEKGSIQDYL